MKKIISIVALCLVPITLFAQTADIEVSYVAHRPDFSDGVTDVTNQYILLANGRESKFFSPKTQYIDSLNSIPEGKAKIAEMTKTALAAGRYDDIPGPDGTMYVVKSFDLGKLRHYDTSGLEKLVYEEPVCAMEWQVCDSTKTVLGYECVKATADYHGRKWTVWFAPEIPVQDGPWKFGALPGLILEAAAEGAQYSFIATGIQQSQKPIGEVPLSEDYEKVKRIDYLKSKRAFMDNPLGKINAQYGSTGVTISASDGADLYNTPRFSDRHNYGGMTRNRYICKKEENQNGKTIEIYSFFQGESRRGSAQGNGATGVAGQEIWRGTLENYRMEERVA